MPSNTASDMPTTSAPIGRNHPSQTPCIESAVMQTHYSVHTMSAGEGHVCLSIAAKYGSLNVA